MTLFSSATVYVAHQNDLYQIVYSPLDGGIIKVILFEDNASFAGKEVTFWELPLATRKRIIDKIERERK